LTDFEYKPAYKTYVGEIHHLDLEAFTHLVVNQNNQNVVWVNGVLFVGISYEETPFTQKRRLEENTKDYEMVFVCNYPKYTKIIKNNILNLEAPVHNFSNNLYYVDLIEWIMNRVDVKTLEVLV